MAMGSCFLWRWSRRRRRRRRDLDEEGPCSPSSHAAQSDLRLRLPEDGGGVVGDHKFTVAQLSAATEGFRESNLVGEGGFGRVYRGLIIAGEDEVVEVAVKQLRRGGEQGSHEFLVECTMLMLLRHPNVVSLVGYCADGPERCLVYEFMPRGSLDAHLFFAASDQLLEWNARVQIAVGAARGLRYLHHVPVIYRDLKASNILLGQDLTPKLSDLGLAKLGPHPDSDDTHVSTRVMGTYGYCAPDYAVTGKLSIKSDVYSFGVLLLELLTGRRASEGLLAWARPHLQTRTKAGLADPALQGRFPRRGLYQVAVVASHCLHDKPNLRPTMSEVTQALELVAAHPI
ncbi:hypothetical protein EJB05_19079, partial [Eragrostis curvula]